MVWGLHVRKLMLCNAQIHVLKSVDEQLQQMEMVNFILVLCYVWPQPLITVFEACNKSPSYLLRSCED